MVSRNVRVGCWVGFALSEGWASDRGRQYRVESARPRDALARRLRDAEVRHPPAVAPPPAPDERHQDQPHQREQRGDIREDRERPVTAHRPRAPLRLEPALRDPECAPGGPVEGSGFLPIREKKRESAMRVERGQIAHRAVGERVGPARARGAPVKIIFERVERCWNAMENETDACGEHFVAPPFPGRVAGVPFVEPARRDSAKIFMESEVCELMPKNGARISGIGAGGAPLHHDPPLVRNRDRGSPVRRGGACPTPKTRLVGCDRDQHVLARARQAWKGVVARRLTEQRAREWEIGGKRDDRKAAPIEALRAVGLGAKRRRGECEREEDR